MVSFNDALEFIQNHDIVVGFKNDGKFKTNILKNSHGCMNTLTDEEGLQMLVNIIASKTKIEVFNDMFMAELSTMLKKYGIMICTD